MIRSFNYTGMKKIERARVAVAVLSAEGGALTFDASIRFDGLDLPSDAMVVVEACYGSSYMRFPFGTVAHCLPPADRRLTLIENGHAALFRVKVIDPQDQNGRILAEADKIAPKDASVLDANRRSLLHVDYQDLGDAIFRLDFSGVMPVMYVNERIEGIADIARRDPAFNSLVYPSIVRQILTEILVVRAFELEETDDGWEALWLRFVKGFFGTPVPDFDSADEENSRRQRLEWTEEAVSAFCACRHAREQYVGSRHLGA
jgi:hypothetical protein